MTNFTGQDIGRYRIIEPLGQGGMATVYRAYDTHLECEVAVKFIRMERLSPEEEQKALKRFEREAKEIARLTHPNIVKVTDYGEYNGAPYLVMPYLPGGTLKQLAGSPVPYDRAARLLAPVARALEAAHQKNLIHRDIKPANILLTEGGQPMISDFGIAKILGVPGGASLTSTNVAIGTPEYMAHRAVAQPDLAAKRHLLAGGGVLRAGDGPQALHSRYPGGDLSETIDGSLAPPAQFCARPARSSGKGALQGAGQKAGGSLRQHGGFCGGAGRAGRAGQTGSATPAGGV